MVTDIIKNVLATIAATAVVVSVSYRIGHRDGLIQATRGFVEKKDTLFIRDTIVIENPVFKERRIVERVPMPVTDTVRITDTLYMYADRESRMYEGDSYKAVISGINPSLDWIEVYPEEKFVTKYMIPASAKSKAKRWGLGVQAGYGVMPVQGTVYASPYVGIGLSYNLMTW